MDIKIPEVEVIAPARAGRRKHFAQRADRTRPNHSTESSLLRD